MKNSKLSSIPGGPKLIEGESPNVPSSRACACRCGSGVFIIGVVVTVTTTTTPIAKEKIIAATNAVFISFLYFSPPLVVVVGLLLILLYHGNHHIELSAIIIPIAKIIKAASLSFMA
jgi:hypothetical protein